MKQGLFYLVLMGWIFSSCSSVNRSHTNSPLAVHLDACLSAKVIVDMGQKLTGYASGGYLFHIFRVSGDKRYLDDVRFNRSSPSSWNKVDTVKAAASYNAIRTSNADVLVNPQFVVEESNWNPLYKWIIVKVTGYPGKVSAIKNRTCPATTTISL